MPARLQRADPVLLVDEPAALDRRVTQCLGPAEPLLGAARPATPGSIVWPVMTYHSVWNGAHGATFMASVARHMCSALFITVR